MMHEQEVLEVRAKSIMDLTVPLGARAWEEAQEGRRRDGGSYRSSTRDGKA